MAGGPLYKKQYTPQFSGHETFPFRYGWLKKVFDQVFATEGLSDNRAACWGDEAIARFGVGKNMVLSMRHWAKAAGIIEEKTANHVSSTPIGKMLFGPKGLDPYMEHPATLWLIHWHIASHAQKTTWFWSFSQFTADAFGRDDLVKKLQYLAKEQNWPRVALATLKNDVACFIRTYASRTSFGKGGIDDALECPLAELKLIKQSGGKDSFRFGREAKAGLSDGVWLWALFEFWARYTSASTLSLAAIAQAPGSPGRVFCLHEHDVAQRLKNITKTSGGSLRWSETAGLKQVIRNKSLSRDHALRIMGREYNSSGKKGAA